MPDITEYIKRIDDMLNYNESNRKNEALTIGLDLLATVKDRVINDSENFEGDSLGSYSESVVPFYYYGNKPTNRDSDIAIQELKEKHGYFASYKDWREINNLPTDKVTTSFTGAMWRSVKPTITEDGFALTVVEIRSDKQEENEKLLFLSARYGDLLALNEQEIEDLREDNRVRLLKQLNRFGL